MRGKRAVRRKTDIDVQPGVQPPAMQQPPSKTEAFLKRARETLDETTYSQFGGVLRDFQSGKVLTDDLIDRGREIFAQYPELLRDFLSFAPVQRDARPVFVPVTPAISSRLVTNAAPSVLHRVDMLGSVGQTSANMRHAVRHVYFANVDAMAGRRRLAAREHRRMLRASQNEDRLLDSLHAPPEGSLAWHLAHGRSAPVVSPRDVAGNTRSSSSVVARSRVNIPSLHEERAGYAAARAARIASVLGLPAERKHALVGALTKLRTPTVQHARLLLRTLSRSSQRPQVKQQLETALLCYLRGEIGPSSLYLRLSSLLSSHFAGVADDAAAAIRSAFGAFFPGVATAFAVRDARLESYQHAQRQRVLAERARGLKGTEGTPLFGPSYVRAMRAQRLEAYRHSESSYDALSHSVINLSLVSRAPPSRGNSSEWGVVPAAIQMDLEFIEHLAKIDTLINQIDGALRDFKQGRLAGGDTNVPPPMAEVLHGRKAAAAALAARRARARRAGGGRLSPAVSPSSSPPLLPMAGGVPHLSPLSLGPALAAADAATSVDPAAAATVSPAGVDGTSPITADGTSGGPDALSSDGGVPRDGACADEDEDDADVDALLPEGVGADAGGDPGDALSDAGSHGSEIDESQPTGPDLGDDSPYDQPLPRTAFCTVLREPDDLRKMRAMLWRAREDLVTLGPQRLIEFLANWNEQEPDLFPPPTLFGEEYA